MKNQEPKNYKTSKSRVKFKSSQDFKIVKEMCRTSKNLYNSTLYSTKQFYFEMNSFLTYPKAYHLLKENEHYKNLPAQTAQQTMKVVERNMRSFFKILEEKRKGNYNKQANLPRFLDKNGYFLLIFTPDLFKIDYNKSKIRLTIPKSIKEKYSKRFIYLNFPKYLKQENKVKEIRIIPSKNSYWFSIEIIYLADENKVQIEQNDNCLSIDLGVDNLATTFDNKNLESSIVDGREIKSYNQYFNKKIAKNKSASKKTANKNNSKKSMRLYQKRNNKIRNDFHLISKRIVEYCVENDISNIIIGNNKNWKNGVSIGKRNNQNFCFVPHGKLIDYIQYKAKEHNINVELINESYTSKTDALSLETISKKEVFVGKRIKRGLFRSQSGKLVNADLNGALNILRKSKGDDAIMCLVNRGVVATPKRIRLEELRSSRKLPLNENIEFVKIFDII